MNSKRDRAARRVLVALWVAIALASVSFSWLYAQSTAPKVDVATIDGVVDPFTEGYVERVINVATEDGANALVFQLDTPGGQLDATRTIVEHFFESPVPIIVYVSPSGARAGSAGVFITYAAHLAAMAPGTNIGAASPVAMTGELTGTMQSKVTNDSAALIRSIATQRGRNAQWGEDAVRSAAAITDQEALQKGAIEIVATDLNDLLNQAHGRTVKVQNRDVTLNTRGASIRQVEMNFFEQFFHILLDPNIALILLNIGSLALIVELYNPGAVIPAVVGIICLTLAAVALFGLPTNWAAVFLILVGIGMMVLDIKVTGFTLTIGGIIAFLLGAFFLFRPITPPEPTAPDVSVSPFVIGGLALFTASFFIFIIGAALRSRNAPVIMGMKPYLGADGIARTILNPQGTVMVKSEEWTAIAQDPPINPGEAVKVVATEGLILLVQRATDNK
ncbi:MAG: nodulation protein NfeD [Chloroflexi bacterium]|nr:nodulation protein NfeD [Chloroflexota bacterium]